MSTVEKLSISLTSEAAADIREAVAGGEYASTSEVIRDALRAWKQRRREQTAVIDELCRLWREGARSGQTIDLDIEDIKSGGRARLAGLKTT